MSIKSTLIDIGVLLVIAASAFGAGFAEGDARGIESQGSKIIAAQHDEQTAKDNAAKASEALAEVRGQLAIQKQELLDAQTVTKAALEQRDTIASQLITATAARKAAERKLANETPACADLQHLPICPALAHRLFGQSAQASGGTSAANNGH